MVSHALEPGVLEAKDAGSDEERSAVALKTVAWMLVPTAAVEGRATELLEQMQGQSVAAEKQAPLDDALKLGYLQNIALAS